MPHAEVRPEFKHIPIIVITGRHEEHDGDLAEEVGADVYMARPFESAALLAHIEALLKR